MKKRVMTIALTAIMALSISSTAFAASWQKNDTGWWWQEDNGSYPTNTWQWIDGNKDGVAECYYFNESGYCVLNTTTSDGYSVNEDGAWVADGVIQSKNVESLKQTVDNVNSTGVYGTYRAEDGNYIILYEEDGVSKCQFHYLSYEGKWEVMYSEIEKVNDMEYRSRIYGGWTITFLNASTCYADGETFYKE